jgi:hypothetical protein
MAREEILSKVYNAIGRLRANGTVDLNVDLVAASAGIARSTFYLDDPDWKEVREVIRGKASHLVKLVEVEVTEASRTRTKLNELQARCDQLGIEAKTLREQADTIYRKLINQLQYYFALAEETPAKRQRNTKILMESGELNQEVTRLRAEVAHMRIQQAQVPVASPISSKRFIHIPSIYPTVQTTSDQYSLFLDQLNSAIPSSEVGKIVVAVYLLCGLPLSGKTKWANQHKPTQPGVSMYIDAISGTRESRGFMVERVRKLTDAPVICVRVRADQNTCVERSRLFNKGAQHVRIQEAIESMALRFEEVALSEPFEMVILA